MDFTPPRAQTRLLSRHQIVAAVGAGADFAAMVAIVELAGASPPVATFPAAVAGAVVNFSLSRRWAFRRRHRGTIASQAVRYSMVSLGGALLNATLLALVLSSADAPYLAARALVAITVSLLYTYPLHARVVFRVAGLGAHDRAGGAAR